MFGAYAFAQPYLAQAPNIAALPPAVPELIGAEGSYGYLLRVEGADGALMAVQGADGSRETTGGS
jgi:hypothetical protein